MKTGDEINKVFDKVELAIRKVLDDNNCELGLLYEEGINTVLVHNQEDEFGVIHTSERENTLI